MLQGGRLTSFIICSKPDIFLLTFSDQAWFFDNLQASVIAELKNLATWSATDIASPIGDIKRHVYEISLFFEVADIH